MRLRPTELKIMYFTLWQLIACTILTLTICIFCIHMRNWPITAEDAPNGKFGGNTITFRHVMEPQDTIFTPVSIFNDNLEISTRNAVLSSSPAKINVTLDWPAFGWNWRDFQTTYPWLNNVLFSNTSDNLFVIEDEKDVGGMIGVHSLEGLVADVTIETDYLFSQFLDNSILDSTQCSLFSTNYRVFEGITKVDNDSHWSDFRIHEILAMDMNLTESNGLPAPVLWLLQPGCALQARYNEYHTIRVQLLGSARYSIVPPALSRYLYPYPSIHLSSFQAQVPFYDISRQSKRFPLFSNIRVKSNQSNSSRDECEAIQLLNNSHQCSSKGPNTLAQQVTLHAGEVLYVPPYWHTHAETSNGGLAAMLDVLSVSTAQLLLLQAHQAALPFRNISSSAERIVSAQVFLVHVLSRLKFVKSPRIFSRRLYHSRFATLFPENSLFIQGQKTKVRVCYEKVDQPDVAAVFDTVFGKIDRELLARRAQFVADKVNSPEIDVAIKELWTNNYVEQIARWAMHSADDAVLFIRECLNQDKKIEIIEEVEGPRVMKIGSDTDNNPNT